MTVKGRSLAAALAGALCLLAITQPAQAQSAGDADAPQPASGASWQVELNLASVDEISGAELGIGRQFAYGQFHLTPVIGGFFYDDPSSVFRRETFSNGREVCRDTRNGRFADDSNCSAAVDVYGRLEAGVDVSDALTLGAGVRVGEETVPYGRVAVSLGAAIDLQGMAGDGYSALGLTLRF